MDTFFCTMLDKELHMYTSEQIVFVNRSPPGDESSIDRWAIWAIVRDSRGLPTPQSPATSFVLAILQDGRRETRFDSPSHRC